MLPDRAMASDSQYDDHSVSFTLNGLIQNVSSVPGDMSLNTYIRDQARLKGTKFMCREGGCGVCVVSLQFIHPATGQERVVSVNSCMFPVYACHGMKVTTVEGIGSRKKGYNEIQTRLTNFYGTQCGYCTPGWVMSLYSFLEANPKATMKDIEDSLSGNLCRCTGYRPILDAFKSFASDRSKELAQKVTDIEDLLKICPKSGTSCNNKCNKDKSKRAPYDCVESTGDGEDDIDFVEVALALPSLKLELRGGSQWYKVAHVNEIFEIFGMVTGTYRLVCGNTAQGILKDQPSPDVFIDINGVAFLKAHSFQSNRLYVGANITLADAIVLFEAVAVEHPADFSYINQLASHIKQVANTPVRNVGTLAGNLSIKHEQRKFQSDIFTILETVGALVAVREVREAVTLLPLLEYLETDMNKKVILQIILPPLDTNSYVVKTYKIAPRAQNALAYVNAGFRFHVNKNDKFKVISQPSIVFGGISPSFNHAYRVETYLNSRQLLDMNNLQNALSILGQDVQPDYVLPDSSPEFRRGLTQALLYRVVLSLNPKAVSEKYRSGGEDITRPLSSGKQEFETDTDRPPLYQPFPKLESLIQCSGEAEYIYDMPRRGDDLYAALVIAKQGPAVLSGLDPSQALRFPGVIAFYSARDIPGENTMTPANAFIPDSEELFASKKILYAGQAVGVVVAQTQELADNAVNLVKIVYRQTKKPVLDVREVVKNNDTSRITLRDERDATAPKGDVKKVIKGGFKMDTQFHFPMENMACVTYPTEDGGLDVFCTSMWIQAVQEAITLILNIPENRINLSVRRLGGSFGQKITRSNTVGCACSLAAYLLQRPVRMVLKLETVMEAVGKRWPCYCTYEAGVNGEGEIQYVKTSLYQDAGSAFNDSVVEYTIIADNNVYDVTKWATKMFYVKTDKSCTAWMRAPGTLEAVTTAEQILEHIAHALNMDPLTVRVKNIDNTYPVGPLINSVKEKSDYESRKAAVKIFNQVNVWKKRGISVVPMRFPQNTEGNYHTMISVYRNDGTVALTHGGVEIGQGINTKAAQTCASALHIPLDTVVVKPTNNLTGPNDCLTGGSFTSESVCFAVQKCCIELNRRLEPVRAKLVNPTWQQVIQQAYEDQVDLNVSYMFTPTEEADKKSYNIYGVVVLEVECDVLTGEIKIIRVDILEDAGKSQNQFVDVGQIEGAFVMGLGYFTFEEQIHNPETGRVLTNSTLTYKIPGPKDIPIDFRVYILKNSDNPLGLLRAKSVGEPPICLSSCIMFAIRQALRSARKDLGLPDVWLDIDAPFTAENIFLGAGIGADKYALR